MSRRLCVLPALALCATGAAALPEEAQPLSALARMPVKEITVFKDGHAFVLHEGKLPTDPSGNVPMDYLPTPVIGTFWPYSADRNVRLTAVTASQRRVLVERTALSLRELLEANPGASISVVEEKASYDAQIVGIPARTSQELEATNPPNTGEALPVKGDVILLKTGKGVSVIPVARIQTVTFKGPYKRTLSQEEFRNLLTLKLEWPGGRPAKTADVGMMYLQKGVRWIPGYRVTLDGKGQAGVKLQATLLNEMVDLNDVTANLVIGVPSFAFKETPDPISLQQTFGPLSQYFQTDSRTQYAFSNAVMTQAAGRAGERMGGMGAGGEGARPLDLGPEVGGSEKAEDLFVFTVKHVTLKKGQRMVLPIAEFTLPYRDVFTVEIPFAPPAQLRGNISNEQQAELARLLNAPRAQHKIRLTNKSLYPLTTAPALLLSGDRALAQGMMTYTAVGADTDLSLTTAGDIRVKKTEKETGRTPNAMQWQGSQFARIDMTGTITLTNFRTQAADVEVTRYVLGHVDKADHDGKAEMASIFEGEGYAPSGSYPSWWGWYSWPGWWHHVNGMGRFTWNLKLPAGKSVDLGYAWHYFWQ
jgi:hypothetical protein